MAWQWIATHWKLWEWPEHIMKWLRSFHEIREAKYRADKEKLLLKGVHDGQLDELVLGKLRLLFPAVSNQQLGIPIKALVTEGVVNSIATSLDRPENEIRESIERVFPKLLFS